MASSPSISSSTQLLVLLFLPTCFLISMSQGSSNSVTPAESALAQLFSFSFNFTNTASYQATDLWFEGNASVEGDRINLITCDSSTLSSNDCTGRVSYNHPVPLYDGDTTASFSTSFTFFIQVGKRGESGDGMAFFLSSYPSSMPSDSAGGSLGLINDTVPYGQGQFVAVEFDTFRNVWDSNDNHVGIDINSVKSRKIARLPSNRALNGTWTATIEYNSTTRMLNASLRSNDDPSMEPAVVTYQVDLKEVLPREVAVGFSAATGAYAELSQILAWSFNSTLATLQTQTTHKGAISKLLVIVLVVPLLASVLCFAIYIKFIRKHRKGSKDKDKMNVRQDEALVWRLEGRSSEFTVYNFPQVQEATGNFSEENKLGQGGFGPVYKGEFPDGLEIAVKRLASHSGQGFTEFRNEIQLIAKLQHTNLVRLLGCCTQEEEKILVYEYLPNKSLDFYIFDETRRVLLDWTRRLAIIEGIAQGLIYLHKHSRLRVIHRDLKASNILLDREMNPKILDFGLAKIFSTNDTERNTRRIVGTYGYMAPEYALEGLFSVKSDVFSFGVLTLEIISGKRTSSLHGYGEFISLQGHAWQLWKDGLWHQIVDASLANEVHTEEIRRYINIALLCVQENAADRPTMSNVVSMLSNESMILPEPMPPGYFHIRKITEEESIVVESPNDLNHMTISALAGR